MIFAESITREQYMRALGVFRKTHPQQAWGISKEPEGLAFWFPRTDVYVCLAQLNNHVYEINGAFRMYQWDKPAKRDAGTQIVDLCRTLGAKVVRLDCFETVENAWHRAGFRRTSTQEFLYHEAPEGWRREYGTPRVIYMEQEIK